MMSLINLVDKTLADPLFTARERAAAGQRVVGLVGMDIPMEVAAAAGAFVLQLPSPVELPTPAADRYLEPMFAPSHRSIAQQWLNGDFDFIDTVILSRSNDSAQRLYYYLCELQRRALTAGPRLLLYDIAKIPRPTSLQHTVAATVQLARDLALDDAQLPSAIRNRNRRRTLFETLAQHRRSAMSPEGSTVARLARAADLGIAPDFDDALEVWLRQPYPLCSGPRLLLAGSAPPDERLHRAIETAGGRVVDEAGDHSIERFGPPLRVGGEALHSVANHYQSLRFGPRSFTDRAAGVAEHAARSRADAVIFWIIEEDESMVWDVPAVAEALRARAVPLLSLTRRRWDASDDACERITEFVTDQRRGS